jgi:hypothetical protein
MQLQLLFFLQAIWQPCCLQAHSISLHISRFSGVATFEFDLSSAAYTNVPIAANKRKKRVVTKFNFKMRPPLLAN